MNHDKALQMIEDWKTSIKQQIQDYTDIVNSHTRAAATFQFKIQSMKDEFKQLSVTEAQLRRNTGSE